MPAKGDNGLAVIVREKAGTNYLTKRLPMALSIGDRYTARNPVDDTFADHDHRSMRPT